MANRNVSPAVKTALELGPVVLFFIAYLKLKDRTVTFAGNEYEGFIAVTAGFILVMVAATLLLWRLSGKISRMQVFSTVLVVVFGGLSVWLNDERFFKMKPTLIYAVSAGLLGFGLWRGKSYLQALMGEMLPLEPEGWMILTRRMAIFFAGLAVANELVWRLTDTETWVYFKTFVLTAAMFGFFMFQGKLFQEHMIDSPDDDDRA